MKLIDVFVKRTPRIIRQFGDAKLARNADGRHELVGGSVSDVAAAKEWVSLFAHEIVFDQSARKPRPKCHGGRHRIPPVFRQQRAGFFGGSKRSGRIEFWQGTPDQNNFLPAFGGSCSVWLRTKRGVRKRR